MNVIEKIALLLMAIDIYNGQNKLFIQLEME